MTCKQLDIISKYQLSVEVFNKVYKESKGYYITTFIDFDTFNIYFHDLNVNKYYPIKILFNSVPDWLLSEIIKCYEDFFFNGRDIESFDEVGDK